MAVKNEALSAYKPIGTFYVEETSSAKLDELSATISKLLESNKPVPAKLIKEWLAITKKEDYILTLKMIQNRAPTKAKEKRLTDEALKYFSNYDGFEFAGEKMVLVGNFDPILGINEKVEKPEQYSFKNMVRKCIHYYLTIGQHLEYDNNKWMRAYYLIIDEYLCEYMPEKDREQYIKYRRYVLSAYLTNLTQGKIFDGAKSTNFTQGDLFKAAHNAIRTKKKKV